MSEHARTSLQLLAERARTVLSTSEGNVPSPCLNVCRMHASAGLCEGCLRTLDEIAGWSQMDNERKRVVWRAIEQRLANKIPE